MNIQRPSNITKDLNVRFGKPCISGTRIAVVDVLGWVAAGMTFDDILSDYDFLDRADLVAAVEYAQYLTEADQIPLTAE